MNIDIKILSKDIKRYLLKGFKIEEIKEGALEQGISEETLNKAINVLIRKEKCKKQILFLSRLLIYFFVSIILFYSYFWWDFSRKEIQMDTSYLEFIKNNFPNQIFTKVREAQKIEIIDKRVKPYSDLSLLNWYLITQDKKNIKSFEILFDNNGRVQKNRILFIENNQPKTFYIFPKGAFEYENSKEFYKEDILWTNILDSIPSEEILNTFGKSLRVISLTLEESEKGNPIAKLNIVYEEKNSFKSSFIVFDKIGKKLRGRGKIISLFSTKNETKK